MNAQNVANNYKFTGFEPFSPPITYPQDKRDAESNLDHTWFRKYSSTQARWLSPDPLGGWLMNPQSLNLYSYVLNRPLNLIDPVGLSCVQYDGMGNIVDANPYISEEECSRRPGWSWNPSYITMATVSVRNSGGSSASGGPGASFLQFLRHSAEQLQRSSSQLVDKFGAATKPARDLAKKAISQIVNRACGAVPDAVSVGAGFDGGGLLTSGGHVTLLHNGVSGDSTLYVGGQFSAGFIAHDAYLAAGAIPNAPSNPGPSASLSAVLAGSRTGVVVPVLPTGGEGHWQMTGGVSSLPATAALQTSLDLPVVTVPFLGYVQNWPRSVCRQITGN